MKGHFWRPVPGFPSVWASNTGEIFVGGLPWSDIRAPRHRRGATDANGYKVVCIPTEIASMSFGVHRLVMLAFVGPCPPGHEVDHIDGDRANNWLPNLEYVTRTENVRRGIARRKAVRS